MTATVLNIKYILDNCSVKEKVELFKQLYRDIADCGINGDTELAHINPVEAKLLKWFGGAGTVNEATGLVQYFGGGGSPPPPPPASQSVTQTSEFPTELKPYITDVLSKAQAIQEKREAEGFIPYTGPQQAAFTPEQEQAFTGIQGLVGAGQQYFDPAARLTAASAMAPTGAEIGQYMSPYMQQVVDIQQREARRAADVEQQQLAAQAVGAGGYGGSRQAILEAEQRRNLQTQLGDIQARGLAAAYEDAQARLAAQRQREMAAGAQFGTLGQVAPQQALKELTAVEAVGAQRQAQQQTALDIARQQFEKEQLFPETTLQQYQSIIRGFPLQPTTYQTSQTTTPAPSYLQQAAGLGGLGIGLAGAFGAFKANGGLIRRARGGKLDKNGGLGSIVVKRQMGSQVGATQVELLSEMSEENLEKAKSDSRFSSVLVEKEIASRKSKKDSDAISKKPSSGISSAVDYLKNIPLVRDVKELSKGFVEGTERLGEGVVRSFAPIYDVSGNVIKYTTGYQPTTLLEWTGVETPEEALTPEMLQEVPSTEKEAAKSPLKTTEEKRKPTLKLPLTPTKSIFDKYGEQIETTKQKLSEANKIEKGLLQKQQEGMDKNRWLAVADLGAKILAQPGGQTFLEAFGKGASESKLIDKLADMNKEEQELALNINKIDKQEAIDTLGLTEKEADMFVKKRSLDLEFDKAKAAYIKALKEGTLDDKELAEVFEKLVKIAEQSAGNRASLEEYVRNSTDPRVKKLAGAVAASMSPQKEGPKDRADVAASITGK